MFQNKDEMIIKICTLDAEHSAAYCNERMEALAWNNYYECMNAEKCVYQKICKLVEVKNNDTK